LYVGRANAPGATVLYADIITVGFHTDGVSKSILVHSETIITTTVNYFVLLADYPTFSIHKSHRRSGTTQGIPHCVYGRNVFIGGGVKGNWPGALNFKGSSSLKICNVTLLWIPMMDNIVWRDMSTDVIV